MDFTKKDGNASNLRRRMSMKIQLKQKKLLSTGRNQKKSKVYGERLNIKDIKNQQKLVPLTLAT
jgi:hypothetical protein